MLNILIAILLFGFIVTFHELGHFILAKLNGIGVIEFAVGMGPTICSFQKGETRYSLKILPFGGYCMMEGEDTDIQTGKAFHEKSVWVRIFVIAAGPIFNFILAFVFAMVIVWNIGYDAPVLTGVMDGYPAQEAGLQAGDIITKIDQRSVVSNRDLSLYLFTHPGEEVTLKVKRPIGASYELIDAVIVPKYSEENQSYMVGVEFSGQRQSVTNFMELVRYSAYEVKYCITSTIDSFSMLFSQKIEVDEAVAGPVQIVSMVGDTVETGREVGGIVLLLVISNWILILSSSLGIMNLLPIPALDGGRLLFLLIELVRGKPVDPKKEGVVHMIGLMILMALMGLILFNDIRMMF